MVKLARRVRESPMPATESCPGVRVLGPFDLVVAGELVECPHPLFSELGSFDKQRCTSGKPRSIIGEVVVANCPYVQLAGRSGSAASLVALCPIYPDEAIILYLHG
ncbi:hypothetical protein EV182_008372, partial [Spiromyces aspiralis]